MERKIIWTKIFIYNKHRGHNSTICIESIFAFKLRTVVFLYLNVAPAISDSSKVTQKCLNLFTGEDVYSNASKNSENKEHFSSCLMVFAWIFFCLIVFDSSLGKKYAIKFCLL